jgi:hypothetical protein
VRGRGRGIIEKEKGKSIGAEFEIYVNAECCDSFRWGTFDEKSTVCQ